MTRFVKVGTVAEMPGRDLLRRRRAVALLAALPLLFYVSQLPGNEVLDPVMHGVHALVNAPVSLLAALESATKRPNTPRCGYLPTGAHNHDVKT